MGGYVALAFWRRHRARVAGLAPRRHARGADTEEGKQKRRAMMETARTAGARGVADAMMPGIVGKTTRATRPEIETELRAILERAPVPGILAAIQAMIDRPDSAPTLADDRRADADRRRRGGCAHAGAGLGGDARRDPPGAVSRSSPARATAPISNGRRRSITSSWNSCTASDGARAPRIYLGVRAPPPPTRRPAPHDRRRSPDPRAPDRRAHAAPAHRQDDRGREQRSPRRIALRRRDHHRALLRRRAPPRSQAPRLARPRPLHPEQGTRRPGALRRARRARLLPGERAHVAPPGGLAHAGAPRAGDDARHRGVHRIARPGPLDRHRPRARRAPRREVRSAPTCSWATASARRGRSGRPR